LRIGRANAEGPLLALATKYANKPENFSSIYNGVPTEKVKH